MISVRKLNRWIKPLTNVSNMKYEIFYLTTLFENHVCVTLYDELMQIIEECRKECTKN